METTVIYSGQKFTCDYNKIIGCGSFCQVHPGRSELGREVAVKSTSKSAEIKIAQNEVKFLQKCTAVKANHIVEFIGYEHRLDPSGNSPERFSFALERALFSLDALMRKVENARGLSLEIMIDLIVDSVSALRTLKELNIAHRDIKHLNILVFPGPKKGRKSSYLFKFCDLGGSRIVDDGSDMRTLVGTPNCLYPKLAHALAKGQTNKWRTEDGYTTIQCDLWSLGCTLFFAAVGSYPFPNDADANVYYEAVSNLPKGAISAVRKNSTTGEYRYNYNFEIVNDRYPEWFRHCLRIIIVTLFHNPSLTAVEDMARVLSSSKEVRFIILERLDIVQYCDLSITPYFSFGYPTLRSVLEIKEDVDYRLLSTKEIRSFDDSLRLDTLFEEPYIVFPAVSEIIWRPKPWRTRVKVATGLEGNARWNRLDLLSQAVVALADCDKMSELFEVTICILKQQLSKLKTDMLTVTDLTTLPIRLAIYARSQSTAIMPFFENDNDKVLLSRIVETADQATEELEKHTEILNSYCTRIDLLLPTVNSLVLDEYEIPGILDTLNRYYLLDILDAEFTQPYVVALVQRCLDRRIKMVNQLFNNSQTSIIHTLLKVTREIIQLLYDSSNCRYDVLHRTALIERPFQEMKNCVERITLGTDIDEHNVRTALDFYCKPERILGQAKINYALALKVLENIKIL